MEVNPLPLWYCVPPSTHKRWDNKSDGKNLFPALCGDTTLLHNPRRQPRPFFLTCGEAATTTLGLKGRQTYEPSEPSGQRSVNPHAEGVSKSEAATTTL